MDSYPLKWITEKLAVGYAPRSVSHLLSLKENGIGAIVNLCAECYDLHEAEREAGFDVLYLPIADEEPPTFPQVTEAIAWINDRQRQGKKVLVHCRYGIGRTGTLVLAYLLHSGIPFDTAEEMMEHTPSWPSTGRQKRFIDDFITELEGEGTPSPFEDEFQRSICRFFDRIEAVFKWDD